MANGAVVKVVFAVYGALDGSQLPRARDVTDVLQKRLDRDPDNKHVEINNANMGGDPADGVVKHFGAIIDLGGPPGSGPFRVKFACQEGQTIDFANMDGVT
jgi:hypothetical protein